ncbi:MULTISPECIES: GNAT family N-acetyltransferase [unclassified Sedimentibacter]|uniref:GNAT family N-acetyltransferase n=1 Tax=unclassified Sedimentibacter TaxID=2649220 RepID=UPI0027E203F3|nr:GNAT family N-acetyltransferase [Sedimentibacter sp. MB35-C1]WMJ78272.1 GNAT family N-acetyltransferase [Sedimentibacter sp. MB35-C1]
MIDPIQNIFIETKRLIIKNPSMDDFPEVIKMKCNRDVMKYTGGITKQSYENELSSYFKKINTFGINSNYVFSVIEKNTNKYIGYCGFKHSDAIRGIEMVFGFAKPYWKKGYAKEATKKILSYGFNNLDFDEISAAVDSLNTASEHILNYIGLRYKNKVDWPDNRTMNLYSIKREEFLKE